MDPIGDPTAPLRVTRGGSFLDAEEKLRAAARTPVTPHMTIRFRCAMDTTEPAR